MKRALAAAILLCAAAAPSSEGEAFVAPHVLGAAEIAGKLRVFATAGDLALSNELVTAAVRRRDGWLTDFWSNRGALPSVRGLGATTDIDGLWQVHPVIVIGKAELPVMASRVEMVDGGIETEGSVDGPGMRFRAKTRFELARDRPRVVMTTTVTVDGGVGRGKISLPGGASVPPPPPLASSVRTLTLSVGDYVRWGNVQPRVGGLRTPRMKYRGVADFIGRPGAGGDLILRSLEREKLFVDYGAKIRGFNGPIIATYATGALARGGSLTARRALAFEPLPEQKPGVRETGTVAVRLADERGRPLPAKIRVDRVGHKAPVFEDEGDLHGADRFAWTGNGQLDLPLAPGRYRLLATSGIERDAARAVIDVRAGKTTKFEASLPRVIDTPGWIAADLHLHQAPSVDADISIPNRVVSIVAEGVEYAAATDHYVVTDLAPDVAWMRERGVITLPLQTVPGCEVSTLGARFGHFNVFPLGPEADVVHRDTTATALFADARKHSPGGIVQVNHPRWDPALGYFSYFGIDDDTGAMSRPGYDASYDTLEVYNGEDARDLRKVRRVFLDFLNLLGRGERHAATGNSDSHQLAFLDPGLPRTMIRHGEALGDDDDWKASSSSVLAAVKAGRSFVTSGPMLEVSVNGMGPGETVRVGRGPVTLGVRVRVRAARFVDVRAVEVLVGPRAKPAHYEILPRSERVLRLDRDFEVRVEAPTFVVVTAQGERGLPNASREATQPFAFSNPIWIDR